MVAFLHDSAAGMGPAPAAEMANASTPHASPVTAAAAKTGCPQLLIPATALQREQHQELQLSPRPGTEWEESGPLVEFQALLQTASLAIAVIHQSFEGGKAQGYLCNCPEKRQCFPW